MTFPSKIVKRPTRARQINARPNVSDDHQNAMRKLDTNRHQERLEMSVNNMGTTTL